jgi:hypothetical protein
VTWWVIAIAACLGRPVWSVNEVYRECERQDVPAFLGCAVVEHESGFWIEMEATCWDGSTDFGWWSFNSRWHDQHRDSWYDRNVAGVKFFRDCMGRVGGDPRRALAYYHHWAEDTKGFAYADKVLAICERIRKAVWEEAVKRAGVQKAKVPAWGLPWER